MSNLGNSVIAAQDDIRHTWERAAWGQATTTNNAAPPWVGGTPPNPERPPEEPKPEVQPSDLYGPSEPSQAERQMTAEAYEHAKGAPGIRAEIEAEHTHAHAALYESIWGKGGRAADVPGVDGPSPQTPAAPTAGDDRTPGY